MEPSEYFSYCVKEKSQSKSMRFFVNLKCELSRKLCKNPKKSRFCCVFMKFRCVTRPSLRRGHLWKRSYEQMIFVTQNLIDFQERKRSLHTKNGHFQRAKRVFLRRPKTRKQKILKLFLKTCKINRRSCGDPGRIQKNPQNSDPKTLY